MIMKLNGDDDQLQAKEGGTPLKWQSHTNKQKPSIRQTILIAALVSLLIGALTTFTAFKVTSHQTSSPIAASTVPLDNEHQGIPKEYVEKVLAYLSQNPPSNSSQHHEKRQSAVGDPHKCAQGDRFVRRTCDYSTDLSTWSDTCQSQTKGPYSVPGQCPENNWCSDHLDGNHRSRWPVVVCRPPGTSENVPTSGNHKGGQYGFHRFDATEDPNGAQLIWSVPVTVNMGAGSISAFLVDDQGSQIILSQNALAGHVRGLAFELCNSGGGPSCVPKGVWNLKAGKDVVDFTFRLPQNQPAALVFSLWGWNG